MGSALSTLPILGRQITAEFVRLCTFRLESVRDAAGGFLFFMIVSNFAEARNLLRMKTATTLALSALSTATVDDAEESLQVTIASPDPQRLTATVALQSRILFISP